MKTIIRTIVAAVALSQSGCATDLGTQATRLDEAMRYSESEAMYARAINAGDDLPRDWHNLGVLYLHERGAYPLVADSYLQRAVQAFTMSARYGSSQAQAALVRLNQPVPPPDLARSSHVRPSNDLAFVAIMGALAVAGRGNSATPIASPLPGIVKCKSVNSGLGVIDTTCQ